MLHTRYKRFAYPIPVRFRRLWPPSISLKRRGGWLVSEDRVLYSETVEGRGDQAGGERSERRTSNSNPNPNPNPDFDTKSRNQDPGRNCPQKRCVALAWSQRTSNLQTTIDDWLVCPPSEILSNKMSLKWKRKVSCAWTLQQWRWRVMALLCYDAMLINRAVGVDAPFLWTSCSRGILAYHHLDTLRSFFGLGVFVDHCC